MPSFIAPIEQTRGYAVRPAAGLRFGNFEGVVNLPPVRDCSVLGAHSYSTLNNQQIYKTVCDWTQSWQPWQQKILLYSIVNRCTLPQLQILATTLEPLRHRDPLKVTHRKPLESSEKSTPFLLRSPSKLPQVITPHQRSMVSNSLEANTVGKDRQEEEETVSEKEVEKSLKNKDDGVGKTKQKQEEEAGTNRQIEKATTSPVLCLDQYASVVSSSLLVAALSEIALANKIEKIIQRELSQAELNLQKDSGQAKTAILDDAGTRNEPLTTTSVSRETSKLSSAIRKEGNAGQVAPQSPANARPGILRSSNGKRVDRSQTNSALFLGGRISFTPAGSRQSRRSEGQRSGSSRYRLSAFTSNSSAAQTPDYFVGKQISVLGPPHRQIRSGQVQKPTGLGDIPVSMQRFYKHRSWWPTDPPQNMHLHMAGKRELSSNFRDQLAAIYEWLHQWESHERLSLLKEVVKLCSGDVLEASVIYIHQKLRDIQDINRLPDKLLLYILSCLPPSDVLNAAQVCRRWRYLCVFDDLWIVKCLELGEEEGIDNVPQLIESAKTSETVVDWMLAYMELHSLVRNMREAEARQIISRDYLSEREGYVERGLTSENMSKRFRIRRHKARTSDAGLTETSTDETGKGKLSILKEESGEAARDKDSDVDSGMIEGELSALTGGGEDSLLPELSKHHPVKARSQRRSLRSSVHNRIQDAVSEKSSNESVTRSSTASESKKRAAKRKEEEEDSALDIHTDLSQSKDLLGKIVPAMSLEWQTPEHEDDFIRYPVYAGKVVNVQKVRKIKGHLGGVKCLQFDRRRLVTGGVDRCVRLWDVRSGRSVHNFYGHKGGIRCVKFDDDILATGSWDSVIFVWNIRRFTQVALLQGHSDSVSCLEITKQHVISGSHDRTVRVWARPTYMCIHELSGHAGAVQSLVADDDHVYSTATDMTIRKTDLLTGMCVRVFERANQSPINCLFMHGSLLLGGDGDGKVYFWNTVTGEAEAAVSVHDQSVNTIQYHKGRFYTGSSDGTMTEYDLMTMTCLRVLRGHKGPVRALQVSDRRFVSCSDDSSVRIWDLQTDKTTSLSSVVSQPNT